MRPGAGSAPTLSLAARLFAAASVCALVCGGAACTPAALAVETGTIMTPAAQAPDRRAAAADLAYVLGEAHALRQVCVGADDGGWRTRMERMLEIEAADPAERRRLTNRFNAGFLAQRAQFPTCSDKVTAAERTVARKGLYLSRRLSAPPP